MFHSYNPHTPPLDTYTPSIHHICFSFFLQQTLCLWKVLDLSLKTSMRRNKPTRSWRSSCAHMLPWASAVMASTVPISTATRVICVVCRCSIRPTPLNALSISEWVGRGVGGCVGYTGHILFWIVLVPCSISCSLWCKAVCCFSQCQPKCIIAVHCV